MMHWTERELSHAVGVEQETSAVENVVVCGFCADSRQAQRDHLFICLRGERYDGHQFIPQAVQAGAVALLIEDSAVGRGLKLPKEVAVYSVHDTYLALQNLAKYQRSRLEGAVVIGVTGSNGKTSSKEMLAGLLASMSDHKYVYSTPGNWNNHIGLPLALLQVQAEHRYVILEMGMNHPNEIRLLSQMASPHHALISCVASAHQAHFKDVEEIARAKLEIIDGMKHSHSHLAYHAFSPGLALARQWSKARGIELDLFGISDKEEEVVETDSDFCLAKNVRVSLDGLRFFWRGQEAHCLHFFTPALASNLLGCLALLNRAFGFAPKELMKAARELRLESCRRFEVIHKKRDGKSLQIFVDDSYNANPASFLAAIQDLRTLLPNGKLAIFMGEMSELGKIAKQAHCQTAMAAANHGYVLLGSQGTNFRDVIKKSYSRIQTQGIVFQAETSSELVELLERKHDLSRFDGILVKGSRSARMDVVSDYIHKLDYV